MTRRNNPRKQRSRPLGRSKLTNSIYPSLVRNLSELDPVVAERDAHIAARLSYYRAHGWKSVDMSSRSRGNSSFAVERSGSTRSQRGLSKSESGWATPSALDAPLGIKRQQSIRFVGANSQPRRKLASRASEQHLDGSSSRFIPSAPAAKENLNHLPTTVAPMCLENPLRRLALQPPTERYTPEDDVASIPSSYRKIRKSRSMFTASDPAEHPTSLARSSKCTNTNTLPSRYSALDKENPPSKGPETPRLRAPKSMNFLRTRREQSQIHSGSQAQNDLAVQLARDNFRQQVEHQTKLKSRPSQFFRPKARRASKPISLRRSLRNSSNNSAPLSTTLSNGDGEPLSVPKQGSLRKTARKVSRGLKDKIKCLFSRKSSGAETNTTYTENKTFSADSSTDVSSCHMDITHVQEEAIVSRGPSRIASIHTVPFGQRVRSHHGSIEENSESEKDVHASDDRSRVTSWADSVTNTIASQSVRSDRERQRLSVIRENARTSSPTIGHNSVSELSPTPDRGHAVDSQRIYSALMKRAEEAREQHEELRNQSIDHIRTLGTAPPRSSSMDQLPTGELSPPTIRYVGSEEDDVFQDNSRLPCNNQPVNVESSACQPPEPTEPEPESNRNRTEEPKDQAKLPFESRDGSVRGNMVGRNSAFFASPSTHLFRTTSPFRRVLRENMEKKMGENMTGGLDYLGSLSAITLPTRKTSSAGSLRKTVDGDAGSEYSYDSANQYQKERKGGIGPISPQHPHSSSRRVRDVEDAPNITNSDHEIRKAADRREVSGASSVNWIATLSANIERLEKYSPDSGARAWPNATGSRHVREMAEIESPEVSSEPKGNKMHQADDQTVLGAIEGNSRFLHEPKASVHGMASGVENEQPLSFDLLASSLLPCKEYKPDPRVPARNPDFPRSTLVKDHLLMTRRSFRRLGNETASSIKSSPGLTAAVERQFGRATTGSPSTRATVPENSTPSHINTYQGQRSDIFNSESEAQVVGSKRMVELFLSSRKRDTIDTPSDSSYVAFI